jgi:hypothetical protein
LQWRPRGENQPADDLTNEVFDKFDPALRVVCQWEDIEKTLLLKLLAEAETFACTLTDLKQRRSSETYDQSKFRKKRQKTDW